jgi:hypothetical protein
VASVLTCLVRGPSSRYPRGYLALIPVWFVVLGAAVVIVSRRLGGLPLWFAATELGGLLLAGLTLMCALATVRRRAFRADIDGIWLGVRTKHSRPKLRQVHVVWPEVAQLRMVRMRYGVMLEISLGPASTIVHRYSAINQAGLLLGAFFMPVGFGRGRPGLTTARADPPRYLVKICDETPNQLRASLAALAPPTLPVQVLGSKAAMQFSAPLARRPQTRRRLGVPR